MIYSRIKSRAFRRELSLLVVLEDNHSIGVGRVRWVDGLAVGKGKGCGVVQMPIIDLFACCTHVQLAAIKLDHRGNPIRYPDAPHNCHNPD